MSTFEQYRESIPDFAKDIRVNLSTITTVEGAPGLTSLQIGRIALACAASSGSKRLEAAISDQFKSEWSEIDGSVAKAAASIMAMNNVYYRALHLAEDAEFSKLPARLRMTVIGNPGIPKVDFELQCLAVSALNGCGMCIAAHLREVLKQGVSREGAQSAIRIAAVIQAAAKAESLAG